MLYMSPERFRVAGTGNDLSSLDDVELTSVLTRATALVNAHCAVPRTPQMHNFAGGTITGERHTWFLGNEVTASRRRFRPWHTPVREVSQFRVLASEGTYLDINPDDLFINNAEGYVEVVALSMGVGVYPVMANLALTSPVGEMNYTYGQDYSVTGEALLETDGLTFRSQHQYWATTPAPVIYKSDVAQTVTTDYTVDSVEGTITFTSSLSASDVVTADYTYTLHENIAEATAIVASELLGERSLTSKGMSGLLEIQVAEVRLRRPMPTAMLSRERSSMPREAMVLLDPFIFRSAA